LHRQVEAGSIDFIVMFAAWVDAEIYQWLDVKGSEHFSDRFHPDAKTVNIKPGYDYYRVKTVYDGDTIVLEDGRKIRLLGINTPEVQHKDKRADAGGEDAKVWLINKLQHARIRLEFDSERTINTEESWPICSTNKKSILICPWLKQVWQQSAFTRLICCMSMSCLQPRIRRSKTVWAFGNDRSMPLYPSASQGNRASGMDASGGQGCKHS